jgi:hypothetical protein
MKLTTTRKSRLATIGMLPVSRKSRLLALGLAVALSGAMVPSVWSTANAKAKKVATHKSAHHHKSARPKAHKGGHHKMSQWTAAAKKNQKELTRLSKAMKPKSDDHKKSADRETSPWAAAAKKNRKELTRLSKAMNPKGDDRKKSVDRETSPWAAAAEKNRKELEKVESRKYRSTWTPRSEAKVKKIIYDALARHDGDATAAYKDVDGRRHKRRNFYDQNLAIASDYFRARKDVERGFTPTQERARIAIYMGLKKAGLMVQRGNGPVSPYSDLEKEYMYKGVADQPYRPPQLDLRLPQSHGIPDLSSERYSVPNAPRSR